MLLLHCFIYTHLLNLWPGWQITNRITMTKVNRKRIFCHSVYLLWYRSVIRRKSVWSHFISFWLTVVMSNTAWEQQNVQKKWILFSSQQGSVRFNDKAILTSSLLFQQTVKMSNQPKLCSPTTSGDSVPRVSRVTALCTNPSYTTGICQSIDWQPKCHSWAVS